MPSINQLRNHEQGLLFSGDLSSEENMVTWQVREDNPAITAYETAVREGYPMVNIAERAEKLGEALNEMSAMSSVAFGFETSLHTATRRAIDAHYGEHVTPIVAENARNKLPRREKKVKKLFWEATGYLAVKEFRPLLMAGHERDARARHDWGRFITKFTGPDNQERRVEYRHSFKKQIKDQVNIRRKLGITATEAQKAA